MTVSSETSKVTYLGDGETVAFTIPFYFLANGEVKVVHKAEDGLEAILLEGTHYTITGAGLADGGMLTIATTPTDYTPAAGERLIIKRDLDFVQETDYPEGGQFPAVAHEQALDRLVMLCQQLDEELSRALRFAESSAVANVRVPEPAAGRALVWNDDESSLSNALVDTANAIVGTSTTSLAIGIGAKTFTTQADKSFAVGTFVMATSDANPAVDYMFGQVTAYSGTSLTATIAAVGGAGIHSDWTIRLAGARGATGVTGATGPSGADGLFVGSEPTVTAALADLFALKDASDSFNPKYATLQSMLDTINHLTVVTGPALNDKLAIFDGTSAGAKAITFDNLMKLVNALTEDSSPDASNDYLITYDASASAPKKVKLTNAVSPSGLPAGHISGLTLSNNATDATNDIDISAGRCRDATDTVDMVLASGFTKQIDAAWSAGTNAGGMDTGSVGNDVYAIWLIKRSDTGVVDALFSLSFTAPTMPPNYNYKRLIGVIVRESNSIKQFRQFGDWFKLREYATCYSNGGGGNTSNGGGNTVMAMVPPNTCCLLRAFNTSTDGNENVTEHYGLGEASNPFGAHLYARAPVLVYTDATKQVYRAGGGNNGWSNTVYVHGFNFTQRSNP